MGDSRFLPYIQLHEFEALLYCDLSQLQQRIADSERAFAALAAEVRGMEPEEIDEGATTAPSKRIINHVPIYDRLKVRVGAPAAAAIGGGQRDCIISSQSPTPPSHVGNSNCR